MAQISFRILGNPTSSGGYTPLISKGEPLEADKVEIPYPSYTTDSECYGLKIYQDVVSYALYTNPVSITSFDGNRGAALNIYIYIPKGYVATYEGNEASPKQILDRLNEEFYTQFMTMKGGVGSATWSYKTQTIEEFSESKALFVDIINEYTLQEKKQKNVVMNGSIGDYANVVVGSRNNIEKLMLDPYYVQLSSYDRLIIVENGETNVDTLPLVIPRPKIYKLYINNNFSGRQIKSDSETITTEYKSPNSYKIADNYSFTLREVKEGKFAEKVRIDDINETVHCIVPEKDKVTEWSLVIKVDGKLAEQAFKEKLYNTIQVYISGNIKRIESGKIIFVGAEIEKQCIIRNKEQDGYVVAECRDSSNKTITLAYTKKVVPQKTLVHTTSYNDDCSTLPKIAKETNSKIKISLLDKVNEYSESDFKGTKIIITHGKQTVIIPFCLKSSEDVGSRLFEDTINIEPFIADKILNNIIAVKSKNFTFGFKKVPKKNIVELSPKKLSFTNRVRKKWWFKALMIFVLCLISGAMGFYAHIQLLHHKKEAIIIKDYKLFDGYLLNGKVYKNDGSIIGHMLESNIYRNENTDEEIYGVYNHGKKVLTIGTGESQRGTQSEKTEEHQTTSRSENTTSTTPPDQTDLQLQAKSTEWLNKIKSGTIEFDEIDQCIQWTTKNPNAPNAGLIKSYCDKINRVKDFILSITCNSEYDDVINRAFKLNSECYIEPREDLRPYRTILQKFIPTNDVTKESIEQQIYKICSENDNNHIISFSYINNLKE